MKRRVCEEGGGGEEERGAEGRGMLKGKERRFEVNMHYTLFPFPLPYYLLYPIDYSEHSDAALIDVMAACGVDNVPRFLLRGNR